MVWKKRDEQARTRIKSAAFSFDDFLGVISDPVPVEIGSQSRPLRQVD
jgi:hypothetical protein